MESVVICLHIGNMNAISRSFNVNQITDYTHKSVDSSLIQLFPNIT